MNFKKAVWQIQGEVHTNFSAMSYSEFSREFSGPVSPVLQAPKHSRPRFKPKMVGIALQSQIFEPPDIFSRQCYASGGLPGKQKAGIKTGEKRRNSYFKAWTR